MKTPLLCLSVGLLLLMGAIGAQKGQNQTAQRPNILFIAVDDLRPELNFYGARHIKSPHLDKLAGESLIFDRAFCNVPVCGASRTSLLTSTRPTRYRYLNAATRKDTDNPSATSLPKLFKQNGYTTISNGKIYHHADDDAAAWDEIWRSKLPNHSLPANRPAPVNGKGNIRGMPYENIDVADDAYPDGDLANKAIADLKKLKGTTKPFFLALGFHKPHLPFTAPKKYWDMYDINSIELPKSYSQPSTTPKQAFHNYGELRNYETVPKKGHLSEDMSRTLIHGYYASVSYIDAQIGRILEELAAQGMAENTIVVLWGDHGWNLGDHMMWCKHCTFATSLKTPLILKVPGQTKGQRTSAIAEYVDIYPSLCELAGIKAPATVEGESLVPLLKGKARKKDYAVSKFADATTLIKGNHFYTEWVNNEGVAYARMLFDHTDDPLELNNLAEKESHREIVVKLGKELREKWGKDYLSK